jgi:SAM-dependent methyltransferase
MENRKLYQETKETYKKLGSDYLKRISPLTPPEFEEFAASLPKGALVLDVGCAGGRDSRKLLDKGFRVIGIDVVPDFLSKAKELCPEADFLETDLLDVNFPREKFDGVWAHAVLLHLTDEDLNQAFKLIKNILRINGKFFFSLKLGNGEGVVRDTLSDNQDRYFNFTNKDEIIENLEKSGLKLDRFKITEDDAGRKEVKWIRIFAERRS